MKKYEIRNDQRTLDIVNTYADVRTLGREGIDYIINNGRCTVVINDYKKLIIKE